MNYLIDTDIIIYSLKNNHTVNNNFGKNRAHPKSLSVITYGELIYGAHKSRNKEKILQKFVGFQSYSQLFLIIDDMDLLIASTALVHNLVLVTNNEKHFSRINGLEIENWTT